ncbi:hypothetical protein P7C73_g1363, partial [Tremellales sp. Uapishka_1]
MAQGPEARKRKHDAHIEMDVVTESLLRVHASQLKEKDEEIAELRQIIVQLRSENEALRTGNGTGVRIPVPGTSEFAPWWSQQQTVLVASFAEKLAFSKAIVYPPTRSFQHTMEALAHETVNVQPEITTHILGTTKVLCCLDGIPAIPTWNKEFFECFLVILSRQISSRNAAAETGTVMLNGPFSLLPSIGTFSTPVRPVYLELAQQWKSADLGANHRQRTAIGYFTASDKVYVYVVLAAERIVRLYPCGMSVVEWRKVFKTAVKEIADGAEDEWEYEGQPRFVNLATLFSGRTRSHDSYVSPEPGASQDPGQDG